MLAIAVVAVLAALVLFNRLRLTFLLGGIALSVTGIAVDDPALGLLGFAVVAIVAVDMLRSIFNRK